MKFVQRIVICDSFGLASDIHRKTDRVSVLFFDYLNLRGHPSGPRTSLQTAKCSKKLFSRKILDETGFLLTKDT